MSNQCEKQESRNYKNQLTKFNYDLIDTYIVLDKYIDRRDFELYDFEPIRTDKNRRFRAKNGETMSTCSLKSWV